MLPGNVPCARNSETARVASKGEPCRSAALSLRYWARNTGMRSPSNRAKNPSVSSSVLAHTSRFKAE
ncbi:hypothetical protein D3C81_1960810 [compost metagenome]